MCRVVVVWCNRLGVRVFSPGWTLVTNYQGFVRALSGGLYASVMGQISVRCASDVGQWDGRKFKCKAAGFFDAVGIFAIFKLQYSKKLCPEKRKTGGNWVPVRTLRITI